MGNLNGVNIENHNHFNGGGSFWDFFKRKKNDLTKEGVRILFIDDETVPVIKSLRSMGWTVDKINDLKNIDDSRVVDSHIIFVDYEGVGKSFDIEKQGLAVLSALKDRYGKGKKLVFYSGYSISVFPEMDKADKYLSKNSSAEEFRQVIEVLVQELNSKI
jgi:hypothetical protein